MALQNSGLLKFGYIFINIVYAIVILTLSIISYNEIKKM